MAPPKVELPQDLRDRLTAAADHLDIRREWIERGDPRCHGRDFGFWRVECGLYGWPERRAAHPAPKPGLASPAMPMRDSVLTVEAPDLALAIAVTLEHAAKRWPESGA